jgi:hypothetical protein
MDCVAGWASGSPGTFVEFPRKTSWGYGGAGKLVKCYDFVEKYFPSKKVRNA